MSLREAVRLLLVMCVTAYFTYSANKLKHSLESCESDKVAMSSDIKELKSLVPQAAKIGFVTGCVVAVKGIHHVEDGDPLIPVYQEWCLQYAQSFVQEIEEK